MRRQLWMFLLTAALGAAAPSEWTALFNGRNLDGWESIGDGVWSAMRDGTLLGQRKPDAALNQAWLYTTRDFGEFDLELDYWVPLGGNSGVSIRDASRAHFSWGPQYDRARTPSHLGYEIQIVNDSKDEYPSGSIYLLRPARKGAQRETDWNTLRIESRRETIRVFLNGQMTVEYEGDPARPKTGPIGLQLHGRSGPAMFRNIRIREAR